MMQTLSLPLTVNPEAATRVAELGLQSVVDSLVAEAFNILPCVQSI
jgi:hypothetical protein